MRQRLACERPGNTMGSQDAKTLAPLFGLGDVVLRDEQWVPAPVDRAGYGLAGIGGAERPTLEALLTGLAAVTLLQAPEHVGRDVGLELVGVREAPRIVRVVDMSSRPLSVRLKEGTAGWGASRDDA